MSFSFSQISQPLRNTVALHKVKNRGEQFTLYPSQRQINVCETYNSGLQNSMKSVDPDRATFISGMAMHICSLFGRLKPIFLLFSNVHLYVTMICKSSYEWSWVCIPVCLCVQQSPLSCACVDECAFVIYVQVHLCVGVSACLCLQSIAIISYTVIMFAYNTPDLPEDLINL